MVARSIAELVCEKLVLKAVKTVGIKIIQETLHAMAASDLTPADRKGNLTQNCAHQKSLQEHQLSILLCFCTQKDRVVSTVSRLGEESSSHQPSRLAQSPAPEPGTALGGFLQQGAHPQPAHGSRD